MISEKSSGFTLLEVMVALAIMAVLSLMTTQAIRAGLANKTLVASEIDREAKLTDALRIIRSDIAAAFHYQDVFCKMENEINAPPASTPAPGAPPANPPPFGAPASATPKPCPPNYTGFIGNSDSLYFTTLSHVRTIRNAQESDQAKVGYFLRSCRPVVSGANNNKAASQCLFRASSPVLDSEIDQPGPSTLLVENVEEFKLRYLGPEHQDFVDTWRTGRDGDDVTKDKFPYAVEITLTLHDKNDPKDRPATQTILAPLWFENNPKKSPSPSPGQNPNGAPQ